MTQYRKLSKLFLFLLLLSLSGCAANRGKKDSIPDPATADSKATGSDVPGDETTKLPVASESAEDAVKGRIKQARFLVARGRHLFQENREEEARVLFRQGLGMLREAPFTESDHPELEQAYQELSADIHALELQALAGPEAPLIPSLEVAAPTDSPLDEIADLNLFTLEVDPSLENLVNEDLRNTRFDIPMIINQEVLKFLNYYQGRGRKIMEEGLRRSAQYMELFREVFEEEGVPLDLIYMAHVESLFKPTAYSRAGARGIWQFIQGTGRLYDLKINWWLDERSDVPKSTRAAARHLKDLYQEFGDWYLALAAYNGGAGRIVRNQKRYGQLDYWTMAKRRLLPRETRNYVPSILAAILIFRNPETYGFEVEPMDAVQFDQVALQYQVDLRVVADSIGVPHAVLSDLNPELRRGVTPFESEDYDLKVPAGKGMKVAWELSLLPPEKRLRLRHHKVRKGETLSQIARRYRTPLRAIADTNRLRNIHRLRLGQDLIIPISAGPASSSSKARRNALRNGSYTVQPGDSLYRISKTYGVELSDLFRWNNLKPGEIIYPGDQIRIQSDAALTDLESPRSGQK